MFRKKKEPVPSAEVVELGEVLPSLTGDPEFQRLKAELKAAEEDYWQHHAEYQRAADELQVRSSSPGAAPVSST